MKIIQVSAIDTTMNGLLRELNEQTIAMGHDLICVCSNGPNVNKMLKEGFDIRPINIDRSINISRNVKSIIEMYRLFKVEMPDIVHVHTPIAAVLGRIAAKLARVPTIIYTAHGFYFHENMSKNTYRIYYGIEKAIARLCTDYIFTQSEEDGQLAIEKKFLKEDRITVISNGVDVTNKFNPAQINKDDIIHLRRNLGINEDDIVITFIGRLVKEKGIFELLESFRQIKEEHVKLIIIGDTSESERDQTTKVKLQKYKQDKNVIFTGYRTDIPNLLYLSDAFCLPSYREGMPRSIIEAMAMECVIIATNIRGSREEVDHGENGYLVPLNSVESLTTAFNKIISNKEKTNVMKISAREKAVKFYDENKVVKTQLAIFKDIMEGK